MKGFLSILSFAILAMSMCFLECDAQKLMSQEDIDEMAAELEITPCWDDVKTKLFDGQFSILKLLGVPAKFQKHMNGLLEGPCGQVGRNLMAMDREQLKKVKGKVMGMLKKRGIDLGKLLEMGKNLGLEKYLG